MSIRFNRIGLFGKNNALEAWDTLAHVLTFFQSQGCEVLLEQECCPDFPVERYHVSQLPRRTLAQSIDLGVVVGGDGTFLHVARTLVDFNVPLLAINLGRLGFLADFSPDHIEKELGQVLQGNYYEEARTLLQVSVQDHEGNVTFTSLALNDVVVHKQDTPRMIEFQTYVDDHFLTRQRSDGLIIATPTGSTAYALSAGGPIMDPRLDAIVLVSINPHTLSNRPVVVPGSSTIRVEPHARCTGTARVTCDGQETFEITPHHQTLVRRHPILLRMIHPCNYNYYDILRTKLNWGGRQCSDN